MVMTINPVSLKGDVYCPSCQSRHSTDAWEYRTRLECNIVDLDSEDITLMSNSWEDHEFTCPTCSNTFFLFDIKRFQPVVKNAKSAIERMLIEIEGDTKHSQAFQLVNKKEVEVTHDKGQFIIDGKDFVSKHNTVEEAYSYLLTYNIDFTIYQD